MRRLSIVVVSQAGGRGLCDIVGSRGHQAALVHDLSRLTNVVTSAAADVALLEIPFDRPSSVVLREVRSSIPGVPIVVVGRDEDIEHAGQALELGAQEFVPEVGDGHTLLSTVGVLLGARRIDSQLQHLRSRDSANATFDAISGDSPAMQDLRRVLRNLVRSSGPGARPPVLLIGETGTGKGLVARTLHYQGARRSGSFVDVNCAAIPPTLIESELFGYERGAFTDAHVGRAGLFETADEGRSSSTRSRPSPSSCRASC